MNIRRFVSVLAVLQLPFVSVFFQGCGTPAEKVDELYVAGKYQEVISRANRYLQEDPGNKLLYYTRGRAKGKRGRYEEGIKDLKTAIKKNNDSDWTKWPVYRIGQLNMNRGNYEEAIDNFTSALKFAPGWGKANSARARARSQLAGLRNGESKLKQQKYNQARSHFETHLKHNSNSIRGNMGMGLALMGLEEYRNARSHFERVLSADPDHRRARRYRDLAAEFLEEEKMMSGEGARSDLVSDLKSRISSMMETGSRRLPADFGEVVRQLLIVNGTQETLDYFQKRAEQNPASPLPRFAVGQIHLEQGNHQKALRALDEAIQKGFDGGMFLLYRGLVRVKIGRAAPATRDFSSALKDDQLSTDLRYRARINRGLARMALNKDQEALADFARAAELKPDESTPYFYQGYIHDQMDQPANAETYLTRAIQREEQNREYLDFRRKVRQELGDTRGAIQDIKKIISLSDEPPMALHYQLARLYADRYNSGKNGEEHREALTSSLSHLRKCLENGYVDRKLVERDGRLSDVVDTSRYRKMIEELK